MPVTAARVNWEAIDEKIPTRATPSGMEARRALYDKIDNNNNGSLTLTEVQGGVIALIQSELPPRRDNYRQAVKAAYNAAKDLNSSATKAGRRRKSPDNIDRPEFHALLVAFREFVELEVLFDSIDRSGAAMLSYKECEKALPKLEDWGISKKECRAKFPDEWTDSMKFEDFAEWALFKRIGGLKLQLDENDPGESIYEAAGDGDVGAVLKAFASWDSDGTGTITCEELTKVLRDLDPSFTEAQATMLFEAADANKDGVIDYAEFANWVMRRPEE